MSVLNTTNDGHFNVLICLVRAVVKFGPVPRARLFDLCGAASPSVSDTKLSQTLNRWKELGLFIDGDRVAVAEPYRGQLGADADRAETALSRCASDILFADRNNERFWENEDSKSADLTRAIAWMLMQDIYTLDTSNAEAIMGVERRQSSGAAHRIIQNDTRWTGLRPWMTYLGFAREDTVLRVDPTDAIRQVLPAVFGDAESMTATEFLAGLAMLLPVLDGGIYRLKVEEAMSERAWDKPQSGWVSSALSRALQRLDFEHKIALEQRSDTADGATLMGRSKKAWRQFTHVRLGQVNA